MGDDVELERTDDLEDQSSLLGFASSTPTPSPSNRILRILRPAFISPPRPQKLRSTSYLDGLRGIAAFIVYVAHSEAWNHDADEIQYGFGYRDHYAAITLPFVRVFITGGHAAVAVFFVISGFVLSRRPLTLIRARSEDLYPVLASAVFRRGVRLYLPFVAVTVSFFTAWHVFGLSLEWPRPQPTFVGECVAWWNEFSLFVNPFRDPVDTWFTYDFPLWTIPVEFQGSILVYVLLLALSRVTRRARVVACCGLALYFLHIGLWQMFCFLCGLLLADLDVHGSDTAGRTSSSSSSAPTVAVFLVGLYLASQPSVKDMAVARETPGFGLLTGLVPTQYCTTQWWRFWPSLAAPMLVHATGRSPSIRALLESRVAQYLGRISFALYLVHIPVATTLGDLVFRLVGYVRPMTPTSAWDSVLPVPRLGPLGLELDFLVAQAVILPVTLYVAELATALLDEPGVTLGKRLYESVLGW